MFYSTKISEDLENLNKLVSLFDHVEVVRLQDNLGKKNFQEDMKKVSEPMTDIVKDVSKDISKTITETFPRNNEAFSDLN